jgi:hypothetical protein
MRYHEVTRSLYRPVSQAFKACQHLRIGLRSIGAKVSWQLLERTASVVNARIELHEIKAVFKQGNRRQYAVAMQAIGIKLLGLVVGRTNKYQALRKNDL